MEEWESAVLGERHGVKVRTRESARDSTQRVRAEKDRESEKEKETV